MREKLRFEELAGIPCLLLRYHLVAQGWIAELQPAAVLISGARTEWAVYDSDLFEAMLDFIRSWDGPILGLCGGHQMIAQAFEAPVGPIRSLQPDENDPLPGTGPGFFKELGPTEIQVVQPDDALFVGLPNQVYMEEEHYWEVKELPPAFELLATTEACRVQAFRHRERPIYGTQFHPERYSNEYPMGRRLLQNFLRLAL